MAEEIFIDTGAWLALADKSDKLHVSATKAYPLVLKQSSRVVTTNLVVAETYNLIRRRLGYIAAIKYLESLRKSSHLIKIYANEILEIQAEETLRRYTDQDFSLADAVSFAVMRERGITKAFAFDHHFSVAGFTLMSTNG